MIWLCIFDEYNSDVYSQWCLVWFSGERRFAAGSKGTEEQDNIFQEAGSFAGQSSGRETKAHT